MRPNDERQSLLRMKETIISELEEAISLSPSNTELTASIVQAKRERNRLVSINQLPTELLIHIFRSRTIIMDPGWCTIIRETGELWAVIGSAAPPKVVPIAFQRAKDFPLTLSAYEKLWHGSEFGKNGVEFASFLDLSLSRIGQWEEIDFSLKTIPPEFMRRLEHPAPLLRILLLSSRRAWIGEQVYIFRGYAPSLRELEISGFPIRWSSGILHDLVFIQICITVANGPSETELLNALPTSPCSERFQLHKSQVHLNSIQDVPSSSTQRILSHGQAPNVVELLLRRSPYATDCDPLTFWEKDLCSFTATIIDIMNNGRELRFLIDSDYQSITVTVTTSPGAPWRSLTIDLHHQSILTGLHVCSSIFLELAPPLLPIILETEWYDIPMEDDLAGTFGTEIDTRVMEIDMSAVGVDPYFTFLCTARSLKALGDGPFPD
ncbi:hypothetical protein FRB90_005269 [Tulasnella sp. 427]|nr:hypothetical protein FRB90_005269 [Tulasnella sp. 427]